MSSASSIRMFIVDNLSSIFLMHLSCHNLDIVFIILWLSFVGFRALGCEDSRLDGDLGEMYRVCCEIDLDAGFPRTDGGPKEFQAVSACGQVDLGRWGRRCFHEVFDFSTAPILSYASTHDSGCFNQKSSYSLSN